MNSHTFVLHINSDLLLHLLHQWHNLASEILKLFAFLIKLVFLNQVVHVLFNFETLLHSIDSLWPSHFWHGREQLINITLWPGKILELSRIKDEVKSGQFLQEPLEIESPLINELDIFVTDCLLWWQGWNWNCWPPSFED